MHNKNKCVFVVGSLNMDLVAFVQRLPKAGETLLAQRPLSVLSGGKGCNQAMAAARLGSPTKMIGRVGDDTYGEVLIQGLRCEGIDCAGIVVTPNCSSGTAMIVVDAHAQNSIVVIPGANQLLSPRDIDGHLGAISSSSVFALQLEIPIETCIHAATKAHESGATVVLNPSPASDLPDQLLQSIDILVPNEHEASVLSETVIASVEDAKNVVRILSRRGPKHVIITLGKDGVVAGDQHLACHFAAPVVRAIDTSCAGDTFMGGLCTGILEGFSLEKAIALGQAASAIKVGKVGGQLAMPRRAEIADQFE
jgi:ribokinase